MNSFTFNGHSSAEFGLFVSNKKIYSMPARDVSFIAVPGRNGDIVMDNNRYENVIVSYTIGLKNISGKIKSIKSWLAQPGYCELTDTYQPGYVRMACFASSLDVDEMINNVGTAVVTFSCKPFMYTEAGRGSYTISATTSFQNPESFPCYPKFTVYGSGNLTFYVNSRAFTINDVSNSVVVDGEMMCVFTGNTLKNNAISFTEFPSFSPGNNTVSLGQNVTRITVNPRYRTL